MPPSGKPRWAASYSMSLQRAFLHPRTRPSFSMSLRASAHTGVAIRSPAAVQNEKLYFGQIRKVLRICPNSLPTGQVSLRGYGLPRRFAPRNDMQKEETRLRVQECFPAGTWYIAPERDMRKHGKFMDVIANQCAHWRGNPFSSGSTEREAVLWANTKSATNLPEQLANWSGIPAGLRIATSLRSSQ